jgi:hypothetical protein
MDAPTLSVGQAVRLRAESAWESVECTPLPDHGQRQLKHWLGVARFELRRRQIA